MDTCKSHCCSAYGTGAEGTIAQLVDPCSCIAQDSATSPTKRPMPAPSTPDEHRGTSQAASNKSLYLVPTPARNPDTQVQQSFGWESGRYEEETGPMPAPDGLDASGCDASGRDAAGAAEAAAAAERAVAAKEKERKDRKAREREAKEAREAQEAREARERDRKQREEIAAQKARDSRDKTEREARERAALAANAGPLSAPGARLEICLDDGWKPVSDDEFKQVQNQLAGGSTKFSITARGAMYIVDFSDPSSPTQANAMTGKSRKLRVVK